MSSTMKCFLYFGIGLFIGGGGSFLYNRKKLRSEVDKIAIQIKKDFEKKYDVVEESVEVAEKKAEIAKDKPPITNYTNMYTSEDASTTIDVSSYMNKGVANPRIISEKDLYSENGSQYIGKTLTLYADGVIADSEMKVVKNIRELVGDDILERFFGTEEEESMLVRNDDTMTDYEILKSSELYNELVAKTSDEEE